MSASSLMLVLVCACTAAADHSLIGDQCSGDVLHNQKASTRSGSEESFVVAYGGDPGVEISCITTQDLSPHNTTVSTLVAGGPGTRFALLKVTATDESDAEFEVNIFGIGSHNRVKRADEERTDKPASKEHQPLVQATVNQLGNMVLLLRSTADRVDEVEKVLRKAAMFSQFNGSSS